MHPDTAIIPNNLAILYDHQGRFAEARLLYQQALAICKDILPPQLSKRIMYRFYTKRIDLKSLNGFPFATHQFHYVHQRLLVAAILLDTWPWVIGELRRVTCPGGWTELVEGGNTFHHAGPATRQFLAWWSAISASKGIDASQMAQISQFLKQGGFSHVRAKTETIPVGGWGG